MFYILHRVYSGIGYVNIVLVVILFLSLCAVGYSCRICNTNHADRVVSTAPNCNTLLGVQLIGTCIVLIIEDLISFVIVNGYPKYFPVGDQTVGEVITGSGRIVVLNIKRDDNGTFRAV